MPGLGNLGTSIPGVPGGAGGWGYPIPGAAPPAPTPLWQQLLLGGMLGTGELGNILQSHKQSQYQDFLLNLIKNPDALSKMVLKAEQPINTSLEQNIGNTVQANLASRGLSQAPGIFAQAETQALAPILQGNYNTALQQVLASLQAPAGTFGANTNLSPLLGLFLRSFGAKQPQPTGVPQQTPQQPGLIPPTPLPAQIDPNSAGGDGWNQAPWDPNAIQ